VFPRVPSFLRPLYNFFTFDFPTAPGVELAFFADDTPVYCTSEVPDIIIRDLQSAMTSISEYFSKWKIKINASKTQSVFFTRRRTRDLPTTGLVLEGVSVEWRDETKYLGVVLDKRLTFKTHIERTTNKVQKLIRILYPLINRRSRLDEKNKILLYKMVFSPIILSMHLLSGMYVH
jgi:Reverse transcriptase (RNA-dependent DNA polymerase)